MEVGQGIQKLRGEATPRLPCGEKSWCSSFFFCCVSLSFSPHCLALSKCCLSSRSVFNSSSFPSLCLMTQPLVAKKNKNLKAEVWCYLVFYLLSTNHINRSEPTWIYLLTSGVWIKADISWASMMPNLMPQNTSTQTSVWRHVGFTLGWLRNHHYQFIKPSSGSKNRTLVGWFLRLHLLLKSCQFYLTSAGQVSMI